MIRYKTFVLGPLGTNCYLVYDEASSEGILVDPAEPSSEVKEYIEQNRINVKYILNTHGHADHIEGNAYFGYPVLIHKDDEPYLEDPSKNLSVLHGGENPEMPQEVSNVADGDVVKLGGESCQLIHTPGHSPGGVCMKCGDLLFAGDTLFCDGVGRTDLPGGSYADLAKSVKEKLFSLPENTKVFPGHGPETTIGHEKHNNPYIQ